MKECLAVLGALTASQDGEVDERNAIHTLSVLVGAISTAEQSTILACPNRY